MLGGQLFRKRQVVRVRMGDQDVGGELLGFDDGLFAVLRLSDDVEAGLEKVLSDEWGIVVPLRDRAQSRHVGGLAEDVHREDCARAAGDQPSPAGSSADSG